MTKAATRTIHVDSLPIAIEIPVGSMDRPSDLSEMIVKAMHSPKGWKYPTTHFITANESLADDVAYCLDWHMGGHERETYVENGQTYHKVSSKGYYHYIGA